MTVLPKSLQARSDRERLVAFGGPALNRQYVAAASSDIVAADDVRLARWGQLLADVDAT